MLSEAYIGIGSNLGDSAQNVHAAVNSMRQFAVDVQPSPLYRTAPQGFRSQPEFYNAACRLVTKLTPFQLMERLLHVEAVLGRRRTFRNAPRLLDLDILLYDRLVLKSPPLVVPHPRIEERLFVLKPLADIAPHVRHPVTGRTVTEMLRSLESQSDSIVEVAWTHRMCEYDQRKDGGSMFGTVSSIG